MGRSDEQDGGWNLFQYFHKYILFNKKKNVGSTMVWWSALLPHSKKVAGLNHGRGLSVWSLHVLPVLAWVSSGYSGFLPQSKNMHVRLIGGSKLPVGVGVSGCLSSCGPVMDWRPVQGVPLPFARRRLG